MTTPTVAIAGTPLATIPARYVMATTELIKFQLDMTPLLNAATVVSATSSLTNVSKGRGVAVSIPGPTAASPYVSQIITGSTALTGGCTFELEFDVTMSDGTVWTQILTIVCPR